MPNHPFIVVDVGNSRTKVGVFESLRDPSPAFVPQPRGTGKFPHPISVIELPVFSAEDRAASKERLRAWLGQCIGDRSVRWMIVSVNRAHLNWLRTAVPASAFSTLRTLGFRDLPLEIHVDSPKQVGMDRLVGAVAVNALRDLHRAAIVVDIGTAITVDLISVEGAFEGGAILPGITMAARALQEQTDALPRSPVVELLEPASPVGKSTLAAIEAGLLWGTVGAIRELVDKVAATCSSPVQIFITGGMSPSVLSLMPSSRGPIVHVPELILSGIAIVAEGLQSEMQ